MKNLRIVLATLLVATLGIAVSSFTVKSYNSRAFADQCYKVITTNPPGAVNISVAIINDPLHANFATELAKLTASNFVSISPFNSAIDCPSTSKVCAICFDPGSTGKTLSDVLTELRALLTADTFTFSDGATFTYSGFTVTVYEFN